MVNTHVTKQLLACMFATILVLHNVDTTAAQSPVQVNVNSPKANQYRARVNQGTVGVISGGISGTYLRMATDLAAVLDDNETNLLRILPIPGKGGVSNIRDLLYLKGIDIAIVQSDILDYIEKRDIFSNIRRRVHYITQLYNAELHIIVRNDIKNILDLQGKKVNFWSKGSATHITAEAIFNAFQVDVKPHFVDQNKGIELLKTGKIAANILLVGKPSKAFRLIKETDNLHLLPIEFKGELINIYLPSRFTHNDYPGLIGKGETVQTIASAAVLAVYNWPENHPRRKKVNRFIDSLISKFDKFREKGRHKKWKEVNLSAQTPGWKRYSYMTRKLSNQVLSAEAPIEEKFRAFLSKSKFDLDKLSEEQKEKLFEMFTNWRSQQN